MADIAASMLAADPLRFGAEAKRALDAGVKRIHMDVMDGLFVPNLSFGQAFVKALHEAEPGAAQDVHLMVENPARYLSEFAEAGASFITVHQEATPHLQRALAQIRALGKKAGLALNPSTSLEGLKYLLDDIDLLLLMTVNPGFGGQKLIPAMLRKVADARELIGSRPIDLQVDGGVSTETAGALIRAGANWLVAGSAAFGAPDMAQALASMRGGS
ncbi:MAG: ribulose-phosphate 3-epimerase [Christensenellaceae bacterium]|jgi:ribulose-phosphate 3-epimerase|nr:ribulose-phosphate 3-epimerase [Christensenellaceae bacterium]